MAAVSRNLKNDLQLALVIAAQAQRVAAEGVGEVSLKPDLSEVTSADLAINDLVVAALGDARPGDDLLTEEAGHVMRPRNGDIRWTWVVDPIDGTYLFRSGIGLSCFSVALCRDGVPQVGAVASLGADQTMYWGMAGEGAWAQVPGGQPIRMQANSMASLRDGVDVSWGPGTGAVIEELGARGARTPKFYSVTRAAVMVASGQLAGWAHWSCGPWDIAAAELLCREAGAVVLDLDGNPPTDLVGPDRPLVIGATRPIAELILEILHRHPLR